MASQLTHTVFNSLYVASPAAAFIEARSYTDVRVVCQQPAAGSENVLVHWALADDAAVCPTTLIGLRGAYVMLFLKAV